MSFYEYATTLIGMGKTEEQIRRAIIREPEAPKTNMHGQVGMNARKAHDTAQALADVRRRAVEDALKGREPSYPG